MNRRIAVGCVASISASAGGVLWPSWMGILLISLGVVTNGILISALVSANQQAGVVLTRLHKLAHELMESGEKNLYHAGWRIHKIFRGEE